MITFALGLFLITLLSSISGSHQATCDENEFACSDGSCIDNFLVCDGEKNCPDGSDETKTVCSKIHVLCPTHAFRCAYGACIDGQKKCDGKQDCADNSDEKPAECGSVPPSDNSSSNANICPVRSFTCDSKQCINEYLVCDGEDNCRDGSDETESRCVNFPCPALVGFQCAYGGCIDKDRKCNGIKDCKDGSDENDQACATNTPPRPGDPGSPVSGQGCFLPEYSPGGDYKVITGCNRTEDRLSPKCRGVPGTLVEPATMIVYNCLNGFSLDTNVNNNTFCYNGVWFPGIPSCLRLCQPLKSNSLVITCSYKDSPVDCTNQRVLPGTKAKLKCKPLYRYQGDITGGDPICGTDGVWTESLFRCKPECGIRTNNNATPLISHGTVTSAVEYPWHSGLYKFDKKLNHIELFCGGSIIAPYMVLTAAHCVNENKVTIDHTKIKVVVGKTNRSWEIIEPSEQRLDVARIFVHSDYRGSDNSYAFDIAILELTHNIVVGRVAMPVCIETIPPWTYIENGVPGTVVGWGRNENNQLTESLMVVYLPYIDQFSCKRQAGNFRSYITHDKFCAKYNDRGAGVQQGDSGGGLVFQKKENELYFIRGIVSTKPKDLNAYATFTNISEKTHVDFIRETRQALAPRHE